MGIVKFDIRKNTYYDSVTLMLISKEIKKIDGVYEALVGMGTELNKELANSLNISNEEIKSIGPNDFFVTVLVDEIVDIKDIANEIDSLLTQKKKGGSSDYNPPTLKSALEHEPNSNLVLISVPGEYAYEESKKALDNNLNVLLFSDNVSMEDERTLKELAVEKGLLMMGPDCGTAIINNVALAFANVIRKGNIGVIGASGTGIQEVTVMIDKLGEGISQVIGTGGRDLRIEIGGLMMLQGIEALIDDPETKVIVLISKPPADEIAEKVLSAIQKTLKPVVVNFIGGDRKVIERYGAYAGVSLEDTARKSVALLRGDPILDFNGFDISDEEIQKIIEREVLGIGKEQRYFRGLYTGGTLADEGMRLLSREISDIYSNIPLKVEYKLEDVNISKEHTCIDFGEDDFTRGRPHPMIDPSVRAERLVKEAEDESVALILMDFVLGYGSHEDPIGEMIPSIERAKVIMASKGKYLPIIASICGTEDDPQNLEKSRKRLEEADVIVMNSNAQSGKLAGLILNKLDQRRSL